LRAGGLLAPAEIRSPAIGNVVSQEFDHEGVFRGEIRRPLLLRNSLHYETLDAMDVVGFGKMLQKPDDCLFIDEIIIFSSSQDVPFVDSLGNGTRRGLTSLASRDAVAEVFPLATVAVVGLKSWSTKDSSGWDTRR
jgi:hypothetical protein